MAFALADVPAEAAAPLNENLSCPPAAGTDLWGALAPSQQQFLQVNSPNFLGNVGVRIGVAKDFGGVGTDITLVNRANGAEASIVDWRGFGGSGWQTSAIQDFADRRILYNQAAGNSHGHNWGYRNSWPGGSLVAQEWNPVHSDADHIPPNDNTEASKHAHDPCPGSFVPGFIFDDGRPSITMTPQSSSGAIKITNAYTYQARTSWNAPAYHVEQALHLNWQVAQTANLRVIIRYRFPNSTRKVFLPTTCAAALCDWTQDANDWDYAMFVWTVGGTDIGFVIKQMPGRAYGIPFYVGTGCTVPYSWCGAIEWHTWQTHDVNYYASAGADRVYTQDYYVGSINQLAAQGFLN
jgi:hypothetical protein